MTLAGWRFRPGIVVTAGAVAFCALTVALGNWQMRRAAYKLELQQELDRHRNAAPARLTSEPVKAEQYRFRPVTVEGEYVPERAILLDNRLLHGRHGYHVLTPLRIAGGDRHVLVNRGWVPAGATRAELPRVSTPQGRQRVEGRAVVPPARVFELGSGEPAGKVWQHLLLDRYAQWSGLALQPVVIEETGAAADGLIREWDRPDLGIDKHRGYAFQWYALAALTVILYVILNLRREPRRLA